MKTKNNFFVIVLVALFTLFAPERADAQNSFESLPFSHDSTVCKDDTVTVMYLKIKPNIDTNNFYVSEMGFHPGYNQGAKIDSIFIYDKNNFLLGKSKIGQGHWGQQNWTYTTVFINKFFQKDTSGMVWRIVCKTSATGMLYLQTRHFYSGIDSSSARSYPTQDFINLYSTSPRIYDCSLLIGPYIGYGDHIYNNLGCFDSLINVLNVRVYNYDMDSLLIKGLQLSLKDGYSGNADSLYVYINNTFIGKYKIVDNKVLINNLTKKVAPNSNSQIRFECKSTSEGQYSLVLDTVFWKYRYTDYNSYIGYSGNGYARDCSLKIKININSSKEIEDNYIFCETAYVSAMRQIKSYFGVNEENWYLNGKLLPITQTPEENMYFQIPLRTPYVDISVRIKDESGRTAYDSVRLIVRQSPVIKISASNGIICEGTPTVISIDTTGFKLANTKWGADGLGASSDNPVTYYFSRTGEYYFHITDSNGCYGGTKIALQEIILPKPEIASIKCDLYADLNPPIDGSYRWYKNYSLLDTSIENHYKVSSPGYYQVRFKDNASGCLSKFASTFADCSATGIDEANIESVKVYPNPFTDKITIESEIGSNFVFININGQIVHEGSLKSQHEEITMDVPPGIYILQITNGEKISHQKVIRE